MRILCYIHPTCNSSIGRFKQTSCIQVASFGTYEVHSYKKNKTLPSTMNYGIVINGINAISFFEKDV